MTTKKSKPGKRAKDKSETHAIRSQYNDAGGRQGIGYFIPPNMDRQEWQKLRKLWDTKLKNSNFQDIELFSHDCSGHFSPFFTKTSGTTTIGGSSATVARAYNPFTEEYYRRVGIFRHHADLWAIFGRGRGGVRRYWLAYHILRLLADGGTYQSIADFFGSKKCPPSIRGKKTYFFSYHHIERPTNKRALNRIMEAWFKENPQWLQDE